MGKSVVTPTKQFSISTMMSTMIKMLCLVCVLYVVLCGGASGQMLTGSSNPLRDIAEKGTSLRKLDDCFCEVGDVAVLMNINKVVCFCILLKLSGPVDVCCCDVETVDTLNKDEVFPLISSLVTRNYFRFFQVCVVLSIILYTG